MKKNAEKRIVRQEESKQLVLSITRSMHEVLHDLVIGAGMTVFQAMLEQDRVELCGPRYAHDPERNAYRAGSAPVIHCVWRCVIRSTVRICRQNGIRSRPVSVSLSI